MAPSAVNEPNFGEESIGEKLTCQSSDFDGHSTVDKTLDLICIGFGPASLAIGIALTETAVSLRALFLEKQPRFGWHSGMQLPTAKMQISFLKDLATPRNPRSHFTFLNYLFANGRLNNFINLATFLPSRTEYEDYLHWCASHFEKQNQVRYEVEVLEVKIGSWNSDGKVDSWKVLSREGGNLVERIAKHVVIAVGGKPVIPETLRGLDHVAHSSSYSQKIRGIQKNERSKKLRFVVIGGGQSAAEIFNDLWERFPEASVKLIIKGPSLRPSDDSPFVNEIFDPERVSDLYYASSSARQASIALDKGTNYGVVRLSLLEDLYEKQYMQRVKEPNELKWRCRIITNRAIVSASQSEDGSVKLKLTEVVEMSQRRDCEDEELDVDYVFTATGYARNSHEDILAGVRDLLESDARTENFPVGRDYGVQFDEAKVANNEAGVWLQGCNESTHGLSDTLLSILAVRGGELVESIMGKKALHNLKTTNFASNDLI